MRSLRARARAPAVPRTTTGRSCRSLFGNQLAPFGSSRTATRLCRIPPPVLASGRAGGGRACYATEGLVPLSELPKKSSQRLEYVQSVVAPAHEIGAGAPYLRFDWSEDRPRTILMIKKHKNKETTDFLARMANYVTNRYPNTRVLIEPSAAADLPHLPSYHPDERHLLGSVVDLVFAVGGDGTILHVASLFEEEAPPLLAFFKGTLGFLTPFPPEEMEKAIDRVMLGGFGVTSRMRLRCRLNMGQHGRPYDGKVVQVMNEVALQGNSVRLTTIDCYVDNKHLGRSTGDGMLVATPTGSTAYSYSCGGSAVHPSLQAILLTPIATRTLPFRPIVLPKGPTLKLRLSEHSRDEANVWIDSQKHYRLPRGGSVEICASPYPIITVDRGEETNDWLHALKGMNRFVERECAGSEHHEHSDAHEHENKTDDMN